MVNVDNYSKKAAKILKEDQEIKNQYSRDWTRWTMYSVLSAVAFTVIVFLEKNNDTIWLLSYLWGVVLEIVVSFIFLMIHCRDRDSGLYQLSDGSFPKGCYFRKVIYYICGIVPLYLCVWLRFHFVWYKALWITPVVFIIILVLGLLYGSPSTNYTSGTSVSVSDMVVLRREMMMAGIDPDKFPAAAVTSNVKDMSISDWARVKMNMELAGFDVSLDKNRKKV